MSLTKFLRTATVLELVGLGRSEFYVARHDGRFPPPDAYLSRQAPVWMEATIAEWQQWTLAGRPGGTWQSRDSQSPKAA